MEHFRVSFREAWFTDTGGVRTQRGDKILYETNIPADQIAEGYILSAWIVATIKETNGDQVWLDDVEVLNGDLLGPTWICLDLPGSGWIYLDLLGSFWILGS